MKVRKFLVAIEIPDDAEWNDEHERQAQTLKYAVQNIPFRGYGCHASKCEPFFLTESEKLIAALDRIADRLRYGTIAQNSSAADGVTNAR